MGIHWVGLLIDTAQNKLYLCDSWTNATTTTSAIAECKAKIREWYAGSYEQPIVDGEDPELPQQKDCDCGIFVVLLAAYLITSLSNLGPSDDIRWPTPKDYSTNEIEVVRKNCAALLANKCKNMEAETVESSVS